MLIEDNLAREFAEKIYELCVNVAKDAHSFIGTYEGKKISSYYKYPISSIDHFLDNPSIDDDLKSKVDFLKYKIPKFYMGEVPENRINYDAIFSGYQSDKIDIASYSEYCVLKKWIEDNKDVLNILMRGEDSDCGYTLKNLIKRCVVRYLFTINASKNVPDDLEEKMKDVVEVALRYYLEEELYIDICIPVCLVVFEEEHIKLSERVEIVKISDEFQKARQKACTYEVVSEDWVAACATHMIVIHDFYYHNVDGFSINAATNDCNGYPLKEIDKIFGIIRLVTGYTLGYEQILSRPIGWMDNACGDLPIVYGAKAHAVNPKETKKFWMHISVSVISKEQCIEIEKLYKAFVECEDKINFALTRFNRCMLRDEIDDMSTDACIGLESLLAGGTKGEITYTISNRIPIVFAKNKVDKYSSLNSRTVMRKIYTFRSKIVHGGNLKDKDKYIENGEEKMFVPYVAVDYLRYTLIFMINNPQFLEPAKIDEYIDKAISNNFEDSDVPTDETP